MMTVLKQPVNGMLHSATRLFDLVFEPEWFEDPIIKDIVKDVDKTDVISPYVLNSSRLGQIPPQYLSGGTKGLIMILKDPEARIYSSVIFGGNCVPWICRLSFLCDFTLVIEHGLELPECKESVCAVGEDGTILNTPRDIWRYYAE